MRRTLGVLAVLLLGPASASAAAPSHAGRWVTDARGRVVVLHGLNVVSKLPPYAPDAMGFGAADAALLARGGFNVVRLGLIWKAVEPQPGRYDDSYLNRIIATQRLLARFGIYSLIDFHQDNLDETLGGEGFPDWAVQTDGLPTPPGTAGSFAPGSGYARAWDNFWSNSPGPGGVGLQDRYAAAWRHVAGRLAQLPYVLGYDVINEPGPGSLTGACLNPVSCPLDAALTGFYRRVLRQIRTTGDRHMVWIEPNLLYDSGGAEMLPTLGDPQIGFTFHDYCISEVISGGADNPALCPTDEQLVLSHAESESGQTGDALLMSEFGSTPQLGLIDRVEGEADADRMSWIEWTYHVNGPPGADFPGTPSVVSDMHKPRAGANIDTALLATLARPYPQTVAGTPQAWSYDAPVKAFRLSYTTQRASDGKRFGAGSASSISAPALIYPGGYAARSTGAAIVSPANAPVLQLASCRGASVITVTVTPTGETAGSCRAHLRITIRPRRSASGGPTTFHIRVLAVLGSFREPVAGARVLLAGHRVRTGRRGRANIRLELGAGLHRAIARAPGFEAGATTVA